MAQKKQEDRDAARARLQAERDKKSLMVLTHERDEAQTAAAQWRDQLARERVGRQADRDEARQSLALCETPDKWEEGNREGGGMRRISQREARRFRKRVEALELAIASQRRAWSQEYVRGVEIARHQYTLEVIPDVVRTARQLGHAVVAVGDDSDTIRFIALPHPNEVA